MTDFEITKMFWEMMQTREKEGVITLEINEDTDWGGKMIKVFSTDIYLPEGETHWFLFEFNKSGKMTVWEE